MAKGWARRVEETSDAMLNLYINRSGRKLPARDRRRLEAAKSELRKAFGRRAA